MRGQWGYVAIGVIIAICAAHFHFSSFCFVVILCYGMFTFFMLQRRIFLVCMLGFFLTYMYMNYVEKRNVTHLTPSLSKFIGKVEASAQIDGDVMSLLVKTEQDEMLRLTYTFSTKEEKGSWTFLQPGTTCTFIGKLEEPAKVRNEGAFNYKEYLYHQHIHYVFRASSFASCNTERISFIHWLFSIRQSSIHYIQETFPKETVGFMNALLYGDRQQLSGDIEDLYQQMGLIHLLAISGSHISLLVVMCLFVMLRVGLTRETATVILVIIVPLYMFMTGASASVVRASVMAVFVLVCVLFSRRLRGMDALSLTAITMMMWNPYIVFDIGFQFSFLATAVLLLSSKVILSGQMLKGAWNLALAAQLASIPITLYHFGRLSPYSLFLNLIFVPYLSFVILPLSLLTLVVSFLFPSLTILSSLLSGCITFSNELLKWCNNLPFLQVTFGQSSATMTLLYSVSILCLFLVWEGKMGKSFRILSVVCFVLIGTIQYTSPYWNPNGSITFIDVGQGEAILIRLPYNKATYLIDTGGAIAFPQEEWQKRKRTYSVGESIVLPYLYQHGVKKIDKLILTHADVDHAGAANEVLKGIAVGEVIVSRKKTISPLEEEIIQNAKNRKASIQIVKSGDSWQEGSSATFTVLSPLGDETKDNNQSIVLYTKLGGLKWLFTGDLEEDGEKQIMDRYPDLRVDVLKVGHHGSKSSTSEAFLQMLKPTTTVISVGKKNRYGHPHTEVIDRLKYHNVSIWRTDEGGAITFTFIGERGTFRSVQPYDRSTE
ncbi:DNA internalization-related competence protein ComEC/Rec2 [Ectobacillus sp. sgz5001026]|uniref:DNA internalization-related competence protein ComEC/Rec2 n=1 Tax=Ectobacillus sp. sgz5001026 TaxID=3242473 RepID=UPI0036D25024